MATIHQRAAAEEAIVPLAFPFTRGGYRHVLLARHGGVALVQRTSTHPDSRGPHWEVAVLRVRRARRLPNGTTASAAEQYPSTARWGRAAWTYTTLAGAAVVFAALAGPRGDPARALARARRESARLGRVHKNGASREGAEASDAAESRPFTLEAAGA
jgi:hypothetical protein